MTVRERVARTQRWLLTGLIVSALAWGAGVFIASFAIITTIASFASSSSSTGRFAFPISALLGVIALVVVLWRGRRVTSSNRVALWIEERIPRLHYALVTAIEPGLAVDTPALASLVAQENVSSVTTRAVRRAILPAFGALIVGISLLYILPAPASGRASLLGRLNDSASGRAVPLGSRLNRLKVEVTPPAYAARPRQTLDDPETVSALVGSQVIVRGAGSNAGVIARLGDAEQNVSGSGSSWRAQIVMPAKPAALRFTDRTYERVIVLDPQTDEPPKVVLTSPVRDTTLRVPQFVVHLHAQSTDDIGLASGYYEYLITSGSGEVFTGRTINTPLVDFGHARSGALDATLDLKTLKLNQGDLVSIRAIVHDANTLSGPSIGTSDTRTIRIARADEYDSVSIEAAAPPPIDSSAMSQRMLILMTEALIKKEKTISHEEWVKQSTDIGSMEDRIRKRVYDILYQAESQDAPADTEEAETDTHLVLNKDLKEAYDALWDAVRSLQIAEPKPALPPMRIALAALDRARLAQRLYLRGTPPKIIVDLQRVRLTGKEKGNSNIRTPRSFADSTRVRLSAKFNATLDLIQKNQDARALSELALLRVDALSSLPDFAAALGQATDAIRSGRDATLPLLRARRALEGPPASTPGLSLWSGG